MEQQKTFCPRCQKRAFDICVISDVKEINLYVELKCPNCKNIVKVPYLKKASS